MAISVALTLLAFLLVWAALVAPDQPGHFTARAFVRLPLEGVIVIALALVLPAPARRLLAWVVGPAIGLLIVVKVLDYGFFTAFDRPFNPGDDWSYATSGSRRCASRSAAAARTWCSPGRRWQWSPRSCCRRSRCCA